MSFRTSRTPKPKLFSRCTRMEWLEKDKRTSSSFAYSAMIPNGSIKSVRGSLEACGELRLGCQLRSVRNRLGEIIQPGIGTHPFFFFYPFDPAYVWLTYLILFPPSFLILDDFGTLTHRTADVESYHTKFQG